LIGCRKRQPVAPAATLTCQLATPVNAPVHSSNLNRPLLTQPTLRVGPRSMFHDLLLLSLVLLFRDGALIFGLLQINQLLGPQVGRTTAVCALSLPMDHAQPESINPMRVPLVANTIHLASFRFIASPFHSHVPTAKLPTDADCSVRRSSPIQSEPFCRNDKRKDADGPSAGCAPGASSRPSLTMHASN
jgi:hypothetical protein